MALYTHWGGSALHETLQAALKRGHDRWTDPSYLGRIIFSEMIFDDVMGNTGFGIEAIKTGSQNYCEANPSRDLIVNLDLQSIRKATGGAWTFDEFVQLTPRELEAFR